MMPVDDLITVLVPTSPIASHPSTEILETTLDSVRFHLPTAQIIVMVDGVREEQREYSNRYWRYIMRVDALCTEKYSNVKYLRFSAFWHQVFMLRFTLARKPTTPLLLFVEHDTPLVTDYAIPFQAMGDAILSGDVNLIRLLHEAQILTEHEYLMCGPIISHDVPLTKTLQFSARPHLAAKTFYVDLLKHFSPEARCFVEDKSHSICQTAPWEAWKMAIYTPEGNCKRSYHIDGRAGAAKFDERQIF